MNKETHVANLIQLARADGEVTPHEMILVQSLALRMGVDGATFQRIAKYPDLVPHRLAKSEDDQRRQLCELVVLAHIDRKKAPEELKLLEHIGVQLGFSAERVDKLVQYFEDNTMPENLNQLFDQN